MSATVKSSDSSQLANNRPRATENASAVWASRRSLLIVARGGRSNSNLSSMARSPWESHRMGELNASPIRASISLGMQPGTAPPITEAGSRRNSSLGPISEPYSATLARVTRPKTHSGEISGFRSSLKVFRATTLASVTTRESVAANRISRPELARPTTNPWPWGITTSPGKVGSRSTITCALSGCAPLGCSFSQR